MKTKSGDNFPILVVDDSPEILDFFSKTLASENISCLTAASVKEACALIEQKGFALLLLDWNLDRSGIEVLRFAKERVPRMPVIVMSSLNPQMWDAKADALMAGADSFIEKLCSPALVSHIKHLMRRHAAQSLLFPERAEDIITFEELEKSYVRHVVRLLGNNVSLAAEKLGMHRHTVADKCRNTDLSDKVTTNT